MSPVLAFGFLGPREHLTEVCNIFKVRADTNKSLIIVIIVDIINMMLFYPNFGKQVTDII